MTELGHTFSYKKKEWKVVKITPNTRISNGGKVITSTSNIICANLLKDGSEGKYILKINWFKNDLEVSQMLLHSNMYICMSYKEKPSNTRDHQPCFDGEYDNVCRFTSQYDNLKKSQGTAITEEETMKLLEKLCTKFNLSFKNGIWKINSKCGGGWGGYKYKNGKRIPYVSLPNKQWSEGESVLGTLRVGLVLHEFAHALHNNRWKQVKDQQSHGRAFINFLDKIVEYYYEEIAEGGNFKMAAGK